MHTLEPLESRIAPATLLGPRAVTYFDLDGDRVTVSVSKGTLQLSHFTFTPPDADGREQLQIIDLAGLTQFDGANLTITAVPVGTGNLAGGDGTVNVGFINATGIDLGAVVIRGDLGAIDVGDARLGDGGLGALSVLSLGAEGVATGAPDLLSDIEGSVGSIRVVGDITDAHIAITQGTSSLGSLVVGGSLFGGSAANSGVVDVIGAIASVRVGGDLVGDAGAGSGSIVAGRLGTVVIGGTIYGGAGENSGQLFAFGAISRVTVGGDLIGSDGEASGLISADAISSVSLDGSILGGFGTSSGRIEVGGNLGTLRIGGSLEGGGVLGTGNENAGTIFVGGRLTSALIGGDIEGGDSAAGLINEETGYVQAGNIGTMTVVGSLIGGSDNAGQLFNSATIRALGSIGNLVIKGGIFGGDSSSGGETNGSGYVLADRILAMTVNGSIFAGSDDGLLSNSGAIRALKDIGTLTVRGSLEGKDTNEVIITAARQAVASDTDVAIRSLTVLGRVFRAEILAGYSNDVTSSRFGNPVNADAQIGSVRVGGDWIASDLIAGLDRGGDSFFGDVNDVKITGGTDTSRISKIASIVIGGRALGENGGGDARNGIGAQHVVSLKVGGTVAIPLFSRAGTDTFPDAWPLGLTTGTFNPNGFNMHVFEVAV